MKSLRIEDAAGKSCFHTSFPVAFRASGRAARCRGDASGRCRHQALELQYEQLPSHVNTGVSIQVFGLRDGTTAGV